MPNGPTTPSETMPSIVAATLKTPSPQLYTCWRHKLNHRNSERPRGRNVCSTSYIPEGKDVGHFFREHVVQTQTENTQHAHTFCLTQKFDSGSSRPKIRQNAYISMKSGPTGSTLANITAKVARTGSMEPSTLEAVVAAAELGVLNRVSDRLAGPVHEQLLTVRPHHLCGVKQTTRNM